MNRLRQTTIAAILQLALCAIMVALIYPNLAKGASLQSEGSADYLVTAGGFTLYIMGIVAVYGIWKDMRWGKALTVAVDAIGLLLSLPALILTPPALKVLAAVLILWHLLVIFLLLWRVPARAEA